MFEIIVTPNITNMKLLKYLIQEARVEKLSLESMVLYNTKGLEIDSTDVPYLEQNQINSNQLPISMNQKVEKGGYIRSDELHVNVNSEQQIMSIYDFALKGKHNQYNTMAASVTGAAMEIRSDKIREAVQTFENLEHRMEEVATIRGVEFINDSKATNINSTWFALESMTKPVILILGGIDKGNDYSLLTDLVNEKVKSIVCLGVDNHKIHEAFPTIKITDALSAAEAVHESFANAIPGDVVLLSPGCASFDLFKNYEDRGKQFKEAVKNL